MTDRWTDKRTAGQADNDSESFGNKRWVDVSQALLYLT